MNAIAISSAGERDEDALAEAADEEEEQEPTPFTYAITSYGADFDVAGLVRRLRTGDVLIPPLRRTFVWTMTQASRFVESLLLGLPVPGIFLAREASSQKLLVIDGQQRLRSLASYCSGEFEGSVRPFALQGLKSRFSGQAYNDLADEDRRRLDDSIIHATIVRQDEPSDDDSSIYNLFDRLNSGGTQLRAQEIRACLYHGPFNELLITLNGGPTWRSVFGAGEHVRMRDVELILRFFALLYAGDQYEEPMKAFLNKFMGRNRALTALKSDSLRHEFADTLQRIFSAIGPGVFRTPKYLNAAVFDSVMVGLARGLRSRPVGDAASIAEAYRRLLAAEDYRKWIFTGTAHVESVKARLALATSAFGSLT